MPCWPQSRPRRRGPAVVSAIIARHEDPQPHRRDRTGRRQLPSIIALPAERQKERDALLSEIGGAEALHQIHVDRAAIEADVQKTVEDWRGSLNGTVVDGLSSCERCSRSRCNSRPRGRSIDSARAPRRAS